jgi:hypothetical protein
LEGELPYLMERVMEATPSRLHLGAGRSCRGMP